MVDDQFLHSGDRNATLHGCPVQVQHDLYLGRDSLADKGVRYCYSHAILTYALAILIPVHGVKVECNTNCIELSFGATNLLAKLFAHHVPISLVLDDGGMTLASPTDMISEIMKTRNQDTDGDLHDTSPRDLCPRTTGWSWNVGILIPMSTKGSRDELLAGHAEDLNCIWGILRLALLLGAG